MGQKKMNDAKWDVKDKICLVTGSNSGIGKQTALGLAKMGATVILACRNKELGKAALDEIIVKSGNASVKLMVLDLSSQESIRLFVNDFKKNYQNLHVLINNAGVHSLKRTETKDGFESNFGINYLGPFLLTNLLLDVLKDSAPSRIINVSSQFCRFASINFDDLQNKEKFEVTLKTGSIPYCQSKLAVALFTFELAERLKDEGVTVNCLCPGFVKKENNKQTKKKSTNFFILSTGKILAGGLFVKIKTPEEGAGTSIYLASSREVEAITGKFFENKKVTNKYNNHFDMEIAKHLWDVSQNLVGLDIV
jgi:NAD(P)-dependent dehydrogenase (short-subunit alcohol dehydrogenase family)